MSNLTAPQFAEMVRVHLAEKRIEVRVVTTADRRKPVLPQRAFLGLERSAPPHSPDFICTPPELPCELKGSQEIYDYCRYSYAHLCSYLLQIIFGQCLSYADLYRPAISGRGLTLLLIVANRIEWRDGRVIPIAESFSKVLAAKPPLYLQQMGLVNVTFNVPDIAVPSECKLFGTLGKSSEILLTQITYTPNPAPVTD